MNVNQGGKRPTMKNTVFKRRSINLAESSVAQEQALSLSALLGILSMKPLSTTKQLYEGKMAVVLVYNNK